MLKYVNNVLENLLANLRNDFLKNNLTSKGAQKAQAVYE